jgi:hypothetical protein
MSVDGDDDDEDEEDEDEDEEDSEDEPLVVRGSRWVVLGGVMGADGRTSSVIIVSHCRALSQ